MWGAATVAAVYPWASQVWRLALKRRWSEQLLAMLGVRLESSGAGLPPGCLVVANHVSWLDIYAINVAHRVAFVSKAEVGAWPLIGWLAANTDTIFLMRGSRGHAKIINAEIAELLASGRCAAIFPEGTTSDGSELLHFHAALLQPAIEVGRPIVPLALSYHTPDGRRSLAPAYAGDTTMLQSLWAVVSEPELRVRVAIAPAIASQGEDGAKVHRRAIAEAARTSIALSLHLSPAPPTPSANSAPVSPHATAV
jgi:1-acyl-sn-glycerol-3-phosphate acyltransferase